MIHRPHVVDDFGYIPREVLFEQLRFGGEEVLERALRALDLAGEHGLLADVHEHEEIGVRESEYRSIETSQKPVGGGQQALQLAGE